MASAPSSKVCGCQDRRHGSKRSNKKGWTELSAYPDKTPALLERSMGKGRLVYLNAAYTSQWYIQWVTPTDKARQGFFRLIERLCVDAGARRTFRMDGDLAQILRAAALQWTDPSGKIGYVVTRIDGEVSWTSGKLAWLGPQNVCYDALGGDLSLPAPVYGKEVAIQMKPGAGRLLAFTAAAVRTVKVSASPLRLSPGQPLSVKVDILDDAGNPVPGKFPLNVEVEGKGGEIAGLRRDLSLESGASVMIQTALSDPVGKWTVAVRDCVSRLSGSATVEAKAETRRHGRAWLPSMGLAFRELGA